MNCKNLYDHFQVCVTWNVLQVIDQMFTYVNKVVCTLKLQLSLEIIKGLWNLNELVLSQSNPYDSLEQSHSYNMYW